MRNVMRNEKAKNIIKLALETGISHSYLSHVINGRVDINGFEKIKKITEVTGTPFELWTRGGTGTPEARQAAMNAWAASTQ
jgi:transcriptional regulator with XRE-family HTH domain